MKRILFLVIAAMLAACVPGKPGPDAPLQLTHNAETAFERPTPTTQAGRDVVANCYDQATASSFRIFSAYQHYAAIAVGYYPDGSCYWVRFATLPSARSAQNIALGVCEHDQISDCTIAAIAVPDMNVPLGARTVSRATSVWVATHYLTANGYAALAATPNGFYGLGQNAPDQPTADRRALQACAEHAENGFAWLEPGASEAVSIYQREPDVCQIVNRRSPDGTMMPRVLPF